MSFVYIQHDDLSSMERPVWKSIRRRILLLADRRLPDVGCLPAMGYRAFDGRKYVTNERAGMGFNTSDAARLAKRFSRISGARVTIAADIREHWKSTWKHPVLTEVSRQL